MSEMVERLRAAVTEELRRQATERELDWGAPLYVDGEPDRVGRIVVDGWVDMPALCRAAIEAALGPGKWLPIETAPRDGTPILLMTPRNGMVVGEWFLARDIKKGGWSAVECDGTEVWGWIDPPPTHWMPLPAPPNHNI